MAVPALPIGHKLQEYRIQSLLGTGGFGLTYLALDENLRLKVALKEYLPGEIALRAGDNSIAPSSTDTAESFALGQLNDVARRDTADAEQSNQRAKQKQ